MLEPMQEFWPLTFWILHQTLSTHIGVIKMPEFNLTDDEIKILHNDIKQSSTTNLRKILKEDIPVQLDDMINYELYIREFS